MAVFLIKIRFLLPFCPYIRLIADGCLLSVTDYRRFYKPRTFKQLFKLCICRCKILYKRIVLIGSVQHIIKTNGIFDGVKFASAHAEFHNIDELILYPTLFKIALGFFCVKAFTFSENLNVHIAISIILIRLFLNISCASASE